MIQLSDFDNASWRQCACRCKLSQRCEDLAMALTMTSACIYSTVLAAGRCSAEQQRNVPDPKQKFLINEEDSVYQFPSLRAPMYSLLQPMSAELEDMREPSCVWHRSLLATREYELVCSESDFPLHTVQSQLGITLLKDGRCCLGTQSILFLGIYTSRE